MITYNPYSPKWQKYRLRYLNEDGSPKFKISDPVLKLLITDPKKFKYYCNGVGSTVGFWGKITYHLIPNWCWFMSILPMADLHDVGYSVPKIFETIEKALAHKQREDSYFHDNICIEAARRGGRLENLRERGAWVRYQAVKHLGNDSFLADKTITNLLK